MPHTLYSNTTPPPLPIPLKLVGIYLKTIAPSVVFFYTQLIYNPLSNAPDGWIINNIIYILRFKRSDLNAKTVGETYA